MPAVWDNKRALDDYYVKILWAIIEVMTPISWKLESRSSSEREYRGFPSVLSVLSYMLKVSVRTPKETVASVDS